LRAAATARSVSYVPRRLLTERSPTAQVAIAILAPAAVGLLCGLALGVSATAYVVAAAFALLGGAAVGYEHADALEGAGRGLAGGMLLGTFVLFGDAIASPRVSLPSSHVLLPVCTTAICAACGLFGGALRARREQLAAPPPGRGEPRAAAPGPGV